MGKSLKRLTVDEARTFLEGIRWPNGPACPHCGKNERIVEVKGGRAGLKRCKDCRKQFTVTVGTIFERSHIPLNDWVYAFDSMCASKKGISALQLSRELSVQYKTAWFMCHRIREAMRSDMGLLGSGGDVEVDETYVGGKPRKIAGQPNKRGRGTSKTPVMALVERSGRVRARVVPNVSASTLKLAILDNVHHSAMIHTDEWSAYTGIGHSFAGHRTVNHHKRQYCGPGGATTNTAESFFAIMKRGIYGSFHNVSKKHLDRYCDEFSFRWNLRKVSDGERVVEAIRQAEGKRLMYRAADHKPVSA